MFFLLVVHTFEAATPSSTVWFPHCSHSFPPDDGVELPVVLTDPVGDADPAEALPVAMEVSHAAAAAEEEEDAGVRLEEEDDDFLRFGTTLAALCFGMRPIKANLSLRYVCRRRLLLLLLLLVYVYCGDVNMVAPTALDELHCQCGGCTN